MKNETKHTPAPWFYQPGGNAHSGRIVGYAGKKSHGHEVCSTICRMTKDAGNVEANAHLMVAAPELLVALEHLLEGYPADAQGWPDAVAARAAIAKAKGLAA